MEGRANTIGTHVEAVARRCRRSENIGGGGAAEEEGEGEGEDSECGDDRGDETRHFGGLMAKRVCRECG